MCSNYTKENLLMDLDAIVDTFRALLYATRVTFDSHQELGLPLENIDVNAKGETDSCIIRGAEFNKYLTTPDNLKVLIGRCAAFSRANLLIACQERVKGYCQNTTLHNKQKFESKEANDQRGPLYMMKCLRDSATHWKPSNTVDYKKWYGPQLEAVGMVVTPEMLESDLPVTNAKLLELVELLSKTGNPPALPGDPKSLTVPG